MPKHQTPSEAAKDLISVALIFIADGAQLTAANRLRTAADVLEKEVKLREGTTTMKTLHNSDISGARKNVKDIKVVGNGDMFQLLCKASSKAEGWMKSTKAMEVIGGCVIQVTTQQTNPDGSHAVAEALTYVPGVKIAPDENGGRKLLSSADVGFAKSAP